MALNEIGKVVWGYIMPGDCPKLILPLRLCGTMLQSRSQYLERYLQRMQLKRMQQGNPTSWSYNSPEAYIQICNQSINSGKSFSLMPPLTHYLHLQLPLQVALLCIVFALQSSPDILSNQRSPIYKSGRKWYSRLYHSPLDKGLELIYWDGWTYILASHLPAHFGNGDNIKSQS